MDKKIIIGIVVVVVIVIGVLALMVGHKNMTSTTQHPTSTPTTNTTSTYTSTTTISSTTNISTTSTVTGLKPFTVYFLNDTNGTYYYVATFNTTLPAQIIMLAWNNHDVQAYQHVFDGYIIAVFGLPEYINSSIPLVFVLNNGGDIGYNFAYGGQWTFGSI
ncbi:hypothetical protein HS7_20580 [Sulfolobales archaeon HS-7]|nr:hypothetical protein HS7_20580 [Sulfolobales archaeon HS-7]